METKPLKDAKGKIAFIFPAQFNAHGAISPMLNFKVKGDKLAISMGISFIDLDPVESYLVIFELLSPSGEKVVTSNGVDGLPPSQIEPTLRTSFLSANFYFEVSEFGAYTFKCSLASMMYNYGNAIDSKEIMFNIIDAGEIDAEI